MELLIVTLVGSAIYFAPDYLENLNNQNEPTQEIVINDTNSANNNLTTVQNESSMANLAESYNPFNPDAIYQQPSDLDDINVEPKYENSLTTNQKAKKSTTNWLDNIRLKKHIRLMQHDFVRKRSTF